MKKIFTMILVAAGTISFASAQSNNSIAFNGHKSMNDHNRNASFAKTNSAAHHDAYFSYKEKDVKAQKTSHEFHQKSWGKTKQFSLMQDHKRTEMSRMKLQHAVSHHQADSKMYGHDSHKW
ncbi:MAG: hypothetical protein ABIY62_00170 [Ginsengibacter sp.]